MNAKQKFKAQRAEFDQKSKRTSNNRLDYLTNQIDTLFDYINELESAVIKKVPKKTKKELSTAIKTDLTSECRLIGLPLHYAAFNVLHLFMVDALYGDIKIDDSTNMQEIYAHISPEGDGSPAAYSKRALTTMRKKADFTNAKIFKGLTKDSTNDDVLKAFYAYIILKQEQNETLVKE